MESSRQDLFIDMVVDRFKERRFVRGLVKRTLKMARKA